MKLLCIADTHGQLDENWYNGEEYDLCLMLGDHSLGDAEKVVKYIPREKIRAIYGNHDVPILGRTAITTWKLPELKYEVINGVRFLGVGGSLRYKEGYQVFWEQDECSEFMAKQPEADVLVTHDLYYGETQARILSEMRKSGILKPTIILKPNSVHPAHIGLKGFAEYLMKYPNCRHIHGHIHQSYEWGRTKSVYMVEMVEV